MQHTLFERNFFGKFEDLIDAAARLDRAGDRQIAVALEEKPTLKLIGHFDKAFLHARDFGQFGFNDAAGLGGFRKSGSDIRREAFQSCLSVLDVRHRERQLSRLIALRIEPEDFLAVRHVADDRLFFDELVDVHEMISFLLRCGVCLLGVRTRDRAVKFQMPFGRFRSGRYS